MAKTVNFRDVGVIFGRPLSGFAEGDDVVKITPMSDKITSKAGADGEVVRSINADDRHTIEIKLLETSPSNAYLNGVQIADEQSGKGILTFSVTNFATGESYTSANAWITKKTEVSKGTNANEVVWTLEAESLVRVVV